MNIVIKVEKRQVRRILAVAASAGVLVLSSCGSSTGTGSGAAVSVVASTDVYGDIVALLAGRLAGTRIAVTSLISDPSADPHSYEASTRNELAISRADLVIENGGGYDDFVDTLRKSAGGDATVLDVVDISGKKSAGGELNEHVWYDVPTVAKLVDRITAVLSKKDAADAATLHANAAAFKAKLGALQATEAAIASAHRGDGVAITEPVPLYLLAACGLVNRTPARFSEAIENGTGVSPRVLQQTLALFSGKAVRLLAYNEQTSGPETSKVLDAARAHGVAVVPVTETLPAGKTYLTWMAGMLADVRSALDRPTT